ncbi:MAG TPA: glycoside hydrolase family 15 protein [Candidatus Acidoferrum sp.]|nr:glycoside hydrolase family 15 protein [Candidatus Acidoferrum sp.]
MTPRIEDYALIGDNRTAALVGRNGSIDWLCLPRFDSPACFAALLGTEDNGFWRLAPADPYATATRAYRRDSLVLETTWHAQDGIVRVVDAMVLDGSYTRVVRRVSGVQGRVAMRMDIKVRFDYGAVVPWAYQTDGGFCAVAGPDAVVCYADVPIVGRDLAHVADFTVGENEHVPFELISFRSQEVRPPERCSVLIAIERADATWRAWSQACTYDGPYREAVIRSLLTLKALAYTETGAIAAAPTTSLPECLGGVRNWDYRYCWIRDATFVLVALMNAGYRDEAQGWRRWLLRAAAGCPQELQILYGLRGERRILEYDVPWLAGYCGSTPVRIGNAASDQCQLDVYGELIDTMYQARRGGFPSEEQEWEIARAVINATESRWRNPDRGLWEIRGGPRHFVHSKVLAWVAFDRGVRAIEEFGLDGPLERWRGVRDEIHADVLARGYDATRGTFTQSYGSRELDAATLLIPLVGFLPPDDERVRGTIHAVERELMRDGFLLRYSPPDASVDGFPPGEGAFLACNFWLADAYTLVGRRDDAEALFERLLAIRNDVGLLSEEYNMREQRLVGNFPQAFSHVGLVNTAYNLHASMKPAEQRTAEEVVVPQP